jgi:hypothetical protein
VADVDGLGASDGAHASSSAIAAVRMENDDNVILALRAL